MDASFTTCWTNFDKKTVCNGLISAWMQPASVKAVVRYRSVLRGDGASLPKMSIILPSNSGGISAMTFNAIIAIVVDVSSVE
jgi:hypothetical protein